MQFNAIRISLKFEQNRLSRRRDFKVAQNVGSGPATKVGTLAFFNIVFAFLVIHFSKLSKVSIWYRKIGENYEMVPFLYKEQSNGAGLM